MGNWARSMALVPKAVMWMAAMRGASASEAGERWRGMGERCVFYESLEVKLFQVWDDT